MRAIKFYEKKNCKSLMSVCHVREHPNEVINVKKNFKWEFLKKNNKKTYRSNILKRITILLMVIFISLI